RAAALCKARRGDLRRAGASSGRSADAEKVDHLHEITLARRDACHPLAEVYNFAAFPQLKPDDFFSSLRNGPLSTNESICDQEMKARKKLFVLCLASCLSIGIAFADDAKKADAKADAKKADAKKTDKEVKVTGIVTDPACAKSGDKAKMSDEACAKKC